MRFFSRNPLRSLLLLLFLGLFSSLSYAQGSNGMVAFKGFELGVHYDSLTIEQHKTLQKRGKFQKLIRYDLYDQYLKQGSMDLKYVRLFYWKGYLHSIDVKVPGAEGTAFRTWIEEQFGEGHQEDAMGYKYVWEKPGYRVFLEQNLVSKDVSVSFIHDETHNRYYKFVYEQRYGR